MSFRLNAKLGMVATVAAVFMAFGAFALGPVDLAKASPDGPPTCTTLTVNNNTVIDCTFAVRGDLADPTSGWGTEDINVTVATTGGASTGVLNFQSAVLTQVLATGNVILPAGNSATLYTIPASFQQALAAAPTVNGLVFVLRTTISCPTTGGTVSFTLEHNSPAQGGNDPNVTMTTPVSCTAPAPATQATGQVTVAKIDQLNVLRGATFAVQQEVTVAGNWLTIATMVLGSSSASNPCSTTQTCTTNPSTATAGTLPPSVTGQGVGLPLNVNLRVIEVGQPSNCYLVDIRNAISTPPTAGAGTSLGVAIPTFTLTSSPTSNPSFTFVNSCLLPGGAFAGNSAAQVVLNGATFGLSNSTHIEIIPAPGSDDDARLDIRARDSNSVPIPNAHVTVIIDKGAIAMRTDTSGPSPSGYEVIEPVPGSVFFGSPLAGDTCDQSIITSPANVGTFNGGLTNPFLSASRMVQDGFTNADGIISACIYVNPDMAPGITPGKINIQAIIETPQSPLYTPPIPGFGQYGAGNIILTASITVVGPPASIKVAAAPTAVACGEKSTITATITDSIGQNVSDHTRVELISNFGATIGGTGATLGFPGTGPVNPLSSSAAETFSGVATSFLLTSTNHVGPYEVVVATGGSVGLTNPNSIGGFTGSTGVFSTAPVSAQVTVTCTIPSAAAPAAPSAPPPVVRAPSTGEGIRPPNTGDAGLADSSGGSLTLVIAGAVFALAGFATLKVVRS